MRYLIIFLLFCSACCTSKLAPTYPDQNIPELAPLEVGTSFSFFDSEGKQTTITKLTPLAYSIKEAPKPKPQGNGGRPAPFISIEVNKDKSRTYTDSYNQTADNGGTIGKDKSDNKQAEDSGNKSSSTSFPWYFWVLVALIGGGFIYLKFIKPL